MDSHPQEPVLWFEYDVPADRWACSPRLRELHGLEDAASFTTQVLLDRVVARERAIMRRRLTEYTGAEGCHSCTYEMVDAHNRRRHIRLVGQSEAGGGEVKRFDGFILDITDLLRGHADEAVAGAVAHRAVIEQAKGALMLVLGVNDAAAFTMLRGYSSRTNTKLVTVAERVATGMSGPGFCRADPVKSLLDILTGLEPEAGQQPAPAAQVQVAVSS